MCLTYKQHRRIKAKNAIDDCAHWVVLRWCFIWAMRDRGLWVNVRRWADELITYMEPGFYRLLTLGVSPEACKKLVDEVLCDNARLDDPAVVAALIRHGLRKEGFLTTPPGVAARAWVKEGLPKVRAAYCGELGLVAFERELCGESPDGR